MTSLSSLTSVHPFDWVDDVMFILDAERRFTFVNAFALRVWNKQPGELLGQTYENAFPTKASQNVIAAFQHALTTQERTEFETFGLRHQAWINVTVSPHQGSIIVQARPIAVRDGMNMLTDQDALTGCLTRAAFQRALLTLPVPYVLAIVDLNLLKSVNTLRGHSGGDAHIRTVAHALREDLSSGALLCRWGGDEFVILSPGRDREALQDLLDRTNAALPRPLPDTEAFTVGMAVREQDTAYERTFALADEQLQLRKEHLKQASAGEREAASFVVFSQELEALDDPGDLIQHALNRLLSLLDFDQAAYTAIEDNEAYFSHQALREGIPAPRPAMNVRIPLTETGLIQVAHRTRTTVWRTDYTTTSDTMLVMVEQGVKSALVTPVFSQGQVIAAIVLRSVDRWQTITPQMRKIVELTALRLEHALELRRAVGEVQSALEAGMLTLGIVLEARDSEIRGHTQRTANMAAKLAESLGLSGGEIGHLRQGAYLHDLGKLCVPEEILRKPGKLDAEEWVMMRSHVQQGYDLAVRIPGLPQDILDVIRSHHERWDGGGYPDGLVGTDIPLMARIFAVCDVYDVLISDRPYKKAWRPEDAVSEIERQSGHHFDPQVVRAFLNLPGGPMDDLALRDA
jgi:diguanylate cyclase (GGDEF)-like protein/putative nucleotidyltransferase with HDIG domain